MHLNSLGLAAHRHDHCKACVGGGEAAAVEAQEERQAVRGRVLEPIGNRPLLPRERPAPVPGDDEGRPA